MHTQQATHMYIRTYIFGYKSDDSQMWENVLFT